MGRLASGAIARVLQERRDDRKVATCDPGHRRPVRTVRQRAQLKLQGVAAMSPNQTIAYESRGSRRFRLLAPLLVTIALAVVSIAPGLMLG
jgi:hypothetical protein